MKQDKEIFTITSRDGKEITKFPDGKYEVKANITLEDGRIAFIDNSEWILKDYQVILDMKNEETPHKEEK